MRALLAAVGTRAMCNPHSRWHSNCVHSGTRCECACRRISFTGPRVSDLRRCPWGSKCVCRAAGSTLLTMRPIVCRWRAMRCWPGIGRSPQQRAAYPDV